MNGNPGRRRAQQATQQKDWIRKTLKLLLGKLKQGGWLARAPRSGRKRTTRTPTTIQQVGDLAANGQPAEVPIARTMEDALGISQPAVRQIANGDSA